ncbi:hypothetical protein [Aquabacter cavernae]|uniref:hypothetical protein n=1 Tax=Aquabacter cavernae TaxID=2496029 RepID=UPI000F8F5596|nr:hypothetical protein [Aquabacter cavernae]
MNATDTIIYFGVFFICYAVLHALMAAFAIPSTTWSGVIVALISAFTAYGLREYRKRRRGA